MTHAPPTSRIALAVAATGTADDWGDATAEEVDGYDPEVCELPPGVVAELSAARPASRILLSLNCGTGHGGFQPGNTCGKGGYGRDHGLRTSRVTKGNIRAAGAKETRRFTDSAGRQVVEHATDDGRVFHEVTHPTGRRSFHSIHGTVKAKAPAAAAQSVKTAPEPAAKAPSVVKPAPAAAKAPAGTAPDKAAGAEAARVPTPEENHAALRAKGIKPAGVPHENNPSQSGFASDVARAAERARGGNGPPPPGLKDKVAAEVSAVAAENAADPARNRRANGPSFRDNSPHEVSVSEVRQRVAAKYGAAAASHEHFDAAVQALRRDNPGAVRLLSASDNSKYSAQQHADAVTGLNEAFTKIEVGPGFGGKPPAAAGKLPPTPPDIARMSVNDLEAEAQSLKGRPAQSKRLAQVRTELDRRQAGGAAGMTMRDSAKRVAARAEERNAGPAAGTPTPSRVAMAERGRLTPKSNGPPPEIGQARYSKGDAAVRTPGVGDFKSPAGHLAEALGGRYSGREHAYIMSPSKAAAVKWLHENGWHGSRISGEARLSPPEGKTLADLPPGVRRAVGHATVRAYSAAPASRIALALSARPASVVLSLSGVAPAVPTSPPPGMPTAIDGVPVTYGRRRIATARPFVHILTGKSLAIDRPRMDLWLSAFEKRKARGLYPFIYPRHLEDGEQPDARQTLGYVVGMDADGDDLYATEQYIGPDAARVAAANGRSVTIVADALDDRGEKYPELLHHLAATPMPALPEANHLPVLAASGAVVMAPVYVCDAGGCRAVPPASRLALALSAA